MAGNNPTVSLRPIDSSTCTYARGSYIRRFSVPLSCRYNIFPVVIDDHVTGYVTAFSAVDESAFPRDAHVFQNVSTKIFYFYLRYENFAEQSSFFSPRLKRVFISFPSNATIASIFPLHFTVFQKLTSLFSIARRPLRRLLLEDFRSTNAFTSFVDVSRRTRGNFLSIDGTRQSIEIEKLQDIIFSFPMHF